MNDQIIIRPAVSSDAKKLSVLLKTVYIYTYGKDGVSDEFANFITKQFSIERLENSIAEDPDQFRVAEFRNNLVGAVEIDYNRGCPIGNYTVPELNKLYILEWFSGKGIGRMLSEAAETMVRNKGHEKMWLWVLVSNKRAINFYRKEGYVEIGNAPFHMEQNSYNNLVMLKHLK